MSDKITDLLKKFIDESKEKHVLTTEAVVSALIAECSAKPDEVDEALEYLADNGVLVITVLKKEEYPLLTAEEEKVLAERVKNGDRQARDEFVLSNMRLVGGIARYYTGRGMDVEDLIQSGMLGLITAVDKFDPDLGFRFSTCAVWWIRQAITKALLYGQSVHIPSYVKEQIGKMKKIQQEYQKTYGRDATLQEIASRMDITEKQVNDLMIYSQPTSSLNTEIGEDGTTTVGDMIEDVSTPSPYEIAEKENLKEMVRNALSKLNPSEENVIKLRYGLDGNEAKTLEEIGNAFNITRERVRQIEQQAFRKIRLANAQRELMFYTNGQQEDFYGKNK